MSTRGLAAAFAATAALLLLAPSAEAGTCEDGRLATAGRDHRCRTAADARALQRDEEPDFAPCERRFDSRWEKAGDASSCRTSGDPIAIGALIAGSTDALVAALRPVSPTTDAARKCAARKLRQAGRYARCRIGAHRKAEKRGRTPDFTRCEKKLAKGIRRAEAKGGCATAGDVGEIEAQVNLFASDVFGKVVAPRPEPPTIMRDVALIDDDVRWTRPFVPGHRTTMDGRVAIQSAPPRPTADALGDTVPRIAGIRATWIAVAMLVAVIAVLLAVTQNRSDRTPPSSPTTHSVVAPELPQRQP